MKSLPNNCRVSKILITPKNWETGGKEILQEEWSIRYRFFDDNIGKKKQVWISDFNRYGTLKERRQQLRDALTFEINRLQENGWNPISKQYIKPLQVLDNIIEEITELTPFVRALENAKNNIKCLHEYRRELKSTLKYIEKAALDLNMYSKPIGEIKRKDVKMLMERCAKNKEAEIPYRGEFTAAQFNRYKKNLSGLFSELIEMEVIENNPCFGIKKQKAIPKKKVLLVQDQRKIINDYIFEFDINWWIQFNIFFHSGARTSELLKVKPEHVDLVKQEVNYQVLKGQYYSWVTRPIKDIALPFWQAAVWDCPQGFYLFAKGLMPGEIPIHRSQIDRRWKRHIIKKLGINVSFYSLKHLNSTETEAILGRGSAALQNKESQKMIDEVYNVDNKKNKDDEIKKIRNSFA